MAGNRVIIDWLPVFESWVEADFYELRGLGWCPLSTVQADLKPGGTGVSVR